MEFLNPEDFEEKEKLGEGGFGIVVKALDKKASELVVIKKHKVSLNKDMVKKEGKILMTCKSPYIVQYIGLIENGEETWVIVMEYCRRGSLESYISNGNKLTVAELRDVASCCLLGFFYLQNKMIIHGDIKPANLLISEKGTIKLGDFGFSVQLNHSDSARRMEGGTLRYMAPESHDNKAQIKSDVWSLGITLIELADGKNPYADAPSAPAVMNRIVFGEPPSITSPNMPEDFVDFVKRCLVKDVEKRASVSELMEHPFVKDSVERIRNDGNSAVILKLAERIKTATSSTSSETSVNVVCETEVGWNTEEEAEPKRITTMREWKSLHDDINTIIVASNCCNDNQLSSLDMSRFVNLRELRVGDECFENVNEVKLIGMKKLQRVLIGENCFTENSCGNDRNRRFYLKDCERVRELKMGCYSFSDYTVCEIANVNSLEVIEMGDLNGGSCNFFNASRLELKNLPQLKSLLFGHDSFYFCHDVLFENLPELISIRLGWSAFCFKSDDDSSQLRMRNLPKLTTLTTEGNDSWSFNSPRYIVLEDMPSLQTVTLPHAFKFKDDAKTKNIGALAPYFPLNSIIRRYCIVL